MIVYFVPDRYGETDYFHNVFDALSAVECTGKFTLVERCGLYIECHPVQVGKPAKHGFHCLFGEIVVACCPRCILSGIYVFNQYTLFVLVINVLLIGFEDTNLPALFHGEPSDPSKRVVTVTVSAG